MESVVDHTDALRCHSLRIDILQGTPHLVDALSTSRIDTDLLSRSITQNKTDAREYQEIFCWEKPISCDEEKWKIT